MKSLDTALNLLVKNDYFVKVDLKSAYDSVPIHESDRNYLQFNFMSKLSGLAKWPLGST